ncbi:hypothetical protein NDR87_08315 [Nocardia sp. CDC159]|uniref:Uncharacterized protein n=1 Tax=Nocardia pulmonis TaxID=2951408 RepID=A0A9X2E3D7_9NOCA|nr:MULTISPECIES: hypothetical protein [Nocardia]MCM6773474.1 hypothetical protein [Nocardia pulmonis]MCM6786361.1 hypothetical protein [Nocardia sp. CDC159]
MSAYDDGTEFGTTALVNGHVSSEHPFEQLHAAKLTAEEYVQGMATAAVELDAAVADFVAANRRMIEAMHAAKRQGLGSSEIVRRTSIAWPAEVALDILAKTEQTARAAQVLRRAGVSVGDSSNDGDGEVTVSLHSSWSRRLVCLHIKKTHTTEDTPAAARRAAATVVGALHAAGYRLLAHPGAPLTTSSAIEYFSDQSAVLIIEEPDSTTSHTTYS